MAVAALVVVVCLVLGWVCMQRREDLLYTGNHCDNSFKNCQETDANGRVCATCKLADATADKQAFKQVDMYDPTKTPGCEVVPTDYLKLNYGATTVPIGPNYTYNHTGDASSCHWWTPCTKIKGPLRKYAGTCFQARDTFVNNCNTANGFKPNIFSSTVFNKRSGMSGCQNWNSYVGYCSLSGTDFNKMVEDRINRGTSDPSLIDFSLLDKIDNPETVNFVGDVLFTDGYRNC